MKLAEILPLLKGVKPDKNGYFVFCPAHADGKKIGRQSLHVSEKDGKILLHCYASCQTEDVVAKLGLTMKNLFAEDKPRQETQKKELTATYNYTDPAGDILYQVLKFREPNGKKTFQQRRPDPDKPGGWLWNMQGVDPLPYRLPELLVALKRNATIFIPEGEKDCDSLAKIGLTATSNHGGAGKWKEVHSRYFPTGAEVVILPDNDDPGRQHAEKVARSLTARDCQVKVLELPDLPEKGDVSDWLISGGTREKLLTLAEQAAEWDPGEGHAADPWPDPEPIDTPLHPVPALPAAIVPEAFREWLRDVSQRMQCPIDFVSAAAMVVAGSIIGGGCGIRPKQYDDWLVIANLWGGIVARPSMLKTPALTEIMKPLARLEIEAKDQYDSEMRDFGVEVEAFKAQREALKSEMVRAAKGGKPKNGVPAPRMEDVKQRYAELEEAPAPVRRRFKTNDSTIEKLGELMNENPRGILMFRDELVGLLCSWDREDRKQDRAFYLEAWNGFGSFTTDRIGRGTIDIQNCCVSILGGIQPSKLMGYLQQAQSDVANDGMVQRFQLLVYPDEPQEWKLVDRWPDKEAKARAWEVLKTLADMNFQAAGAELPEDETIPFFHFSPGGQTVFNEWLTELEVKLRQDDAPVMVEHLAKYRSLMPSLALVLHLVGIADGGTAGPVSEQAAGMAAAWCEYLESHARRIYGLSEGAGAAAELAKKIQAGKVKDGFTVREVYHQKQWRLLDKKEIVQEACEALVDADWLKVTFEEIPGRQPKETFKINPKIFS